MKQTTFALVAWEKMGKVTRRQRFLGEMNLVVPWAPIMALIEPHHPKAGHGTQPMPLEPERMLRIHFMQLCSAITRSRVSIVAGDTTPDGGSGTPGPSAMCGRPRL